MHAAHTAKPHIDRVAKQKNTVPAKLVAGILLISCRGIFRHGATAHGLARSRCRYACLEAAFILRRELA